MNALWGVAAILAASLPQSAEGPLHGAADLRLPVQAGDFQVDCPITRGVLTNTRQNVWALEKDARLRIWPAGSPWLPPGTFRYPVRQRGFASMTQMAKEPSYVDGGEVPGPRKIYYPWGLDLGGSEGHVEVVAATDGQVVSASGALLPGEERWDFGDGSPPVTVRSDGKAVPLAPGGYAETVHRFEKPGLYVVRVERANAEGMKAVAHLAVRVGVEL